jgi:O-antigen ligase
MTLGRFLDQVAGLRSLGAKLSTGLAALSLAAAPIPLGSVDRGWMLLWLVALSVACLLAPGRELQRAHAVLLAPVLAAVGAFCVVAFVQYSDLGWLPEAPVWRDAEALLGSMTPLPAIRDNLRTADLLLPALGSISFMAAFFAALDPKVARVLIRCFLISGSASAVFAMGVVLFETRAGAETHILSWPFQNRNHAATLYATCAAVFAVQLLRVLKTASSDEMLTSRSWELWVAVLGFLVCSTATFMTVSRGGILALFGALALLGCWFLGGWLTRGRLVVTAVAVFGVGVLAISALEGSVTGSRMLSAGLIDEGRLEIYRAVVSAIREHMWLGTGLGTFAEAITPYRHDASTIRGVWLEAHSSPLQFGMEMGTPLLACFLSLWCFVFAQLWRGSRSRRRYWELPLCGLAALAVGSIHSLVDFSLQIPGYAVVWSALLGIGLSQSVSSRDRARDRSTRKASGADETRWSFAHPAADRS